MGRRPPAAGGTTLAPLTIVLTAAGCPGAVTLIRQLQANGERTIRIHGVDMRPDAAGRFFCDGFDVVPPGGAPEYVPALAEVVARVRPDLLFVQSSHEIEVVARHRDVFEALGARVLADGLAGIETAGDKARLHAACAQIGVPQPRWLEPRSLEELATGARELGYPGADVCCKPPVAKGSRGFQVLSARAERGREALGARPGDRPMTLAEYQDLLRGEEPFPRLLLMEYVDGPEITVELFADRGEMVVHQARTREAIRAGLAMAVRTVDRPDLVELTRRVVRHLGLDYYQSVQWIGGKLLEVNPRVSTFVYQEDFNIPYLGIKYTLGELDARGAAEAQSRLRFTRRSVRYYDQVFWDE